MEFNLISITKLNYDYFKIFKSKIFIFIKFFTFFKNPGISFKNIFKLIINYSK